MVIIAVGVNADRHEVLGMKVGASEAEPIWREFLRKVTGRGLRDVKLASPKPAKASRPPSPGSVGDLATLPRRVHEECADPCCKSGRRVVSASIPAALAQDTPEAASMQWRAVADQIRPKEPKVRQSRRTPRPTCWST